MLKFTEIPILEIFFQLQPKVKLLQPRQTIEFEVLNPDLNPGVYSGNKISACTQTLMHHSYKTWLDLAHHLHCKMLTPLINSECTIIIKYEKLDYQASFHNQNSTLEEKYGTESIFSLIHKKEEGAFIFPFFNSLQNVSLSQRKRILNLGVNNGDEFEIIKNHVANFNNLELIGIDFCPSAIEAAREKFKNDNNVVFFESDINDIEKLHLEKFDLIISIGTLQSSTLRFNETLMNIVQNLLLKNGAMILGFPNCRWIDGEMIYGAKAKNYNYSEMSVVLKDVMFAKKYLQQKKFRVTVTGKDYLFVTATSIGK